MKKLSQKESLELAASTLQKNGALKENALPLALGIIDAENQGIKSHGFHYLPIYCLHLKCEKVKGSASPKLNVISNVAFKVNADNGFAHRAITLGMEKLIPSAKENGISSLAITNSYNCGVLGYHTKNIAKEKLIAIGCTNAPASIAPFGGTKPVVGTNPISMAIYNKGDVKIIIDQSASVVAKSEISVRAKSGEKIPEGWALDKVGKATTDPEEALKGTLVSAGGYKGWGFGLMAEILVAGMTGGRISKNVAPLKAKDGEPHNLGQFYIIIDPTSGASFYNRLEELTAVISSEEGTRMPGQYTVPQTEVDVPDDLWNLAIGLSKAKHSE